MVFSCCVSFIQYIKGREDLWQETEISIHCCQSPTYNNLTFTGTSLVNLIDGHKVESVHFFLPNYI